jgi:hypothetical protein
LSKAFLMENNKQIKKIKCVHMTILDTETSNMYYSICLGTNDQHGFYVETYHKIIKHRDGTAITILTFELEKSSIVDHYDNNRWSLLSIKLGFEPGKFQGRVPTTRTMYLEHFFHEADAVLSLKKVSVDDLFYSHEDTKERFKFSLANIREIRTLLPGVGFGDESTSTEYEPFFHNFCTPAFMFFINQVAKERGNTLHKTDVLLRLKSV